MWTQQGTVQTWCLFGSELSRERKKADDSQDLVHLQFLPEGTLNDIVLLEFIPKKIHCIHLRFGDALHAKSKLVKVSFSLLGTKTGLQFVPSLGLGRTTPSNCQTLGALFLDIFGLFYARKKSQLYPLQVFLGPGAFCIAILV